MKNALRLFVLSAAVVGLMVSTGAAKTKLGEKPWIGVYTRTVTDKLAKEMDLSVDYGAVIRMVVEDSPADEAGLKTDDVILKIDGKKIADASDLTDMVREDSIGQKVVLTVLRDGKEKTVDVTLGSSRERPQYHVLSMEPKKERYMVYSDRNFPYIGVELENLSVQLGDYFGVKEGEGALISAVEEDSPAEKAGLAAGDVIVDINGEKVLAPSDASGLIRDMEPGDTASVKVIRNKKPKTFKVEVEESESHPMMGNYNIRIPQMDIQIPDMKGMYRYYTPDNEMYFDADELQQQLDELRDKLQDLQRQLEDLRKD